MTELVSLAAVEIVRLVSTREISARKITEG